MRPSHIGRPMVLDMHTKEMVKSGSSICRVQLIKLLGVLQL